MRLSSRLLAAVKDLKKKKKKKEVRGRRSIVKARSAATEFPEDILVEILVRLPAYSLMRFKCVSKFWFSLISSRYFTNFYYKLSSSMMRGSCVFMYAEQMHDFREAYIPFSSSDSSTASFLRLNRDLNFPGSGTKDRFKFVNALRGLVCLKVNSAILQIINLTTWQVLNVPCVNSNTFSKSDHCLEWNYFGYDPVNDEYKLLRTVSTDFRQLGRWTVRSETKVLVLGAGASWRNTKSPTSPQPHHHPYGRGISINGVLYYAALMNKMVLTSFDLNSEQFNLIEFPIEVTHKLMNRLDNLMNYKDQIAVIDCSRLKTECILDLWVLEDARESKWSHKTFDLPYHQLKLSLELSEMDVLGIRGTSRRGEVKLSQRYWRYEKRNKSTYHALYDLDKKLITRGVAVDRPFASDFIKTALWEDGENIMYLEA